MALHETHIPPERGHDDGCDCAHCRMMTEAEARSLAEEINATPGFEVTHALWYGFGQPRTQRRAFSLGVQYHSRIPGRVNVAQSFDVVDEAHWLGVRDAAIANGPELAYDDPHPEWAPTAEDWARVAADVARMEAKRRDVLAEAGLRDDD